MRRAGVEVRTDARASAILFEGKRATGVRYLRERGGPAQEVRARREVILSAGTVNTARLLQISGVGPAALLQRAGRPGRARAARRRRELPRPLRRPLRHARQGRHARR